VSEERHNEELLARKTAQAHAGEVVAGSGKPGKPRRMAQMVSVRLDGDLVGQLRIVAEQRGDTLSDLLREGAELVVQNAPTRRSRVTYEITGARETVNSHKGASNYAIH
jgi:uncharacterized protein (DUF4415 family)